MLGRFIHFFNKPSRIVAVGGGIAAAGELLFTPLQDSTGTHSWVTQLIRFATTYKTDPQAVQNQLMNDGTGRDIGTLFVSQIKQNIVPAAITGGVAGFVAAILHKFKM